MIRWPRFWRYFSATRSPARPRALGDWVPRRSSRSGATLSKARTRISGSSLIQEGPKRASRVALNQEAFSSAVGFVSTLWTACTEKRRRTPSATWMVTTSSLTAATVPWIPPDVTTGSPFVSPSSIVSRALRFFFSGRTTMNQKTTTHIIMGRSMVSRMPPWPLSDGTAGAWDAVFGSSGEGRRASVRSFLEIFMALAAHRHRPLLQGWSYVSYSIRHETGLDET